MVVTEHIHSLKEAAKKIVTKSLGVLQMDSATIICDEDHKRIADALEEEIKGMDARATVYVLGKLVPRPVQEIPASLHFELKRSQVTIFLASRLENENTFRRSLVTNTDLLGIRHAHIINVFEHGIVEGMSADSDVLAKLNILMQEGLARAKVIKVLSDLGTDLEFKVSPREKYLSYTGKIKPGAWENLPSGELVFSPTRVDGIFMCDSVPPGNFAVDHKELQANPLRIELLRSKLVSVSGGPGKLAQDVTELLAKGVNTDRIGEVMVGTNYAIQRPASDELHLDMIKPGVSFAFGMSPALKSPIVRWRASTDHPMTATQTSLELDGERVIDNGKYQKKILEKVGAL